MRAFLELLHGSLGNQGVDRVGTVHDMRFVFLDNDTKLLFCTAYDGDWDPYIDDFGTKIPDILDLQFGEVEGWPGIRSPKIKDFIVKHQIPAHFWYVANPNLTVVETRRLEKVGKARRRISRQGGLRNESDATGEGVAPPLLQAGDRFSLKPLLRSVRCLRWKIAVDRTRAAVPPPLISTRFRQRCCAIGRSRITARTS